MTTYRLLDGASGRPGVGSSGTQPPSAGASYSGPFLAGTSFRVTASNLWFQGYWWWVPATVSQTAAQKFALWNTSTISVGTVVSGSVVTSGTLTANAFNYVPLTTPVQLAVGSAYMAVTGFTSTTGFPQTINQFGASQPYAAGITNGPLLAFSDTGGSNPSPVPSMPQGLFSAAVSDPAVNFPNNGDRSSIFWVDVQVTDQAPAFYTGSYRLWPGSPAVFSQTPDTANNFTLATEFSLTYPCVLNKIWFYSGPAATTQLPTEVGVWQISNQTLVAATHVTSPTWSGAAGSGWVSTTIPGSPVLQPGVKYKVSVFNGAGTPVAWNVTFIKYWNTFDGISGITNGPLSAPNVANSSAPGQDTYHQGATFAWPDTYDSIGTGDNYWVDLEVTPVPAVNATTAAKVSEQTSTSASSGT